MLFLVFLVVVGIRRKTREHPGWMSTIQIVTDIIHIFCFDCGHVVCMCDLLCVSVLFSYVLNILGYCEVLFCFDCMCRFVIVNSKVSACVIFNNLRCVFLMLVCLSLSYMLPNISQYAQ